MKRSKTKATLLFLFSLACLAFSPALWAEQSPLTQEEREYLIQLYQGQFERAFLEKSFFLPEISRERATVEQNVIFTESKRNYDDFLNAWSVGKARRFQKRWKHTLSKAHHKFGVDQEVVVAILMVETGLGNVLGRYPVISVFSSILLEKRDWDQKTQGWTQLDEDQAYRAKRLEQKSAWAKVELEALLRIIQETGQSPLRIKGSYAGAFGIPQFLPSSYLKWGFDSDQSGTVNLYLVPDAIYSTANYLAEHGWQQGLSQPEKQKVIWEYNHSKLYVDTVLGLAKKIQTQNQRQAQKEKSNENNMLAKNP